MTATPTCEDLSPLEEALIYDRMTHDHDSIDRRGAIARALLRGDPQAADEFGTARV